MDAPDTRSLPENAYRPLRPGRSEAEYLTLSKILTAVCGVHPILARVVSLSFAHAGGWLSHRRFTFRLTTPPTLAEFVRYAGVQSTVALINYGIYVVVILLRPDIWPLFALVISSGVAMFFSYFGIRFAAFQVRTRRHE